MMFISIIIIISISISSSSVQYLLQWTLFPWAKMAMEIPWSSQPTVNSTRVNFGCPFDDDDVGSLLREGQAGWDSPRQVLRLTQKVRRENEPLKTVKLNFAATFCRKFSLRTPCWAHIWVVLHTNWYFLMAKRIFIHHSKSNHCQSVNPQFGTQLGTWISHFGHMDFSNSCFFTALHNSTTLVKLTWNGHAGW